MCFSATASFVAAGALTTAGVYGLSKSKTTTSRLYAAIPLLFGVQQLIEGLQWLYVGQGSTCQPLGYGFLFFAFLVWPTFLPIVAYRLEKNKQRRQLLRSFIYLGLAVSVGLLITLIKLPLEILVSNNSLAYNIAIPLLPWAVTAYVFVTCGSTMLSSRSGLQLLGVLGLLSMLASWIFFIGVFTSVWCFFAALLSLVVLSDLKKLPK